METQSPVLGRGQESYLPALVFRYGEAASPSLPSLSLLQPSHPQCRDGVRPASQLYPARPPRLAQLRAWLQRPRMNSAAVTKAERTKCTGGLLSVTFFELKYNSHTTIHPL